MRTVAGQRPRFCYRRVAAILRRDGWRANALRMLQMAGIVKGDAELEGISLGARFEIRKKFTDIFAFC